MMQVQVHRAAPVAGKRSTVIHAKRSTVTRRRCSSVVVARASSSSQASSSTREPAATPATPVSAVERHRGFLLASERLEELLEEAYITNKDTVPTDHLDTLTPEERLTLFTNLGTLLLMGEVLVCWLFGEMDPLGGLDFNMQSAHAALLGVAFGSPLLLCSIAARTSLFRRNFPVLEQMHQQQADLQTHFIAGMNPTQVGIWLSFIVVPGLLTLLPATQAGVLWSVSFAQQALLQTWGSGVHFPHLHLSPLAHLLAPLASCYVAGMASASCLGVRPRHMELLRDAVRNADAYFRLAAAKQPQQQQAPTTAPAGSSSSSFRYPTRGVVEGASPFAGSSVFASSSSLTLEQDAAGVDEPDADAAVGSEAEDSSLSAATGSAAQVAADAFKTLAMVWLLSRKQVAHLACITTGLNMMYYSLMWTVTGDATTPIVAAMLHAGAEVWFGQQLKAASSKSNKGARV